MTKEIMRRCIVCRELKNRENMLKITKRHDTDELVINPNSKIFGRSVYLCYNKSCIDGALKKSKLEKALRSSISEGFKAKLKEQLPMV